MAACDWAEERLILSAVGIWVGLEAQEGNRHIGNGEAEGRCTGEWTHHSAGPPQGTGDGLGSEDI